MVSGKVLLPMKMAEKYTNNANSHQLVKPWWTSRSCSMVSCPRRPSHIYLRSWGVSDNIHKHPGKARNSQIMCSPHHHGHQYHDLDGPQLTWEEERRVKAPGELHLSLCWSSTAKVTWGGGTLKVLIVWIFDCEKMHPLHELITWDKDTSTYLRATKKCALKLS